MERWLAAVSLELNVIFYQEIEQGTLPKFFHGGVFLLCSGFFFGKNLVKLGTGKCTI